MNETFNAIKYCAYRLPCGLCSRTYTQCPYATNTVEITCTTSEVTNGISTDEHTTKMGC